MLQTFGYDMLDQRRKDLSGRTLSRAFQVILVLNKPKQRGSNENFLFFVSEENLKEDQMETPLCLYCVWAGYQKFDICFQGCTTH